MDHEAEFYKNAADARVRADRMELGLPSIVDPLRGDMDEVERLRAENADMKHRLDYSTPLPLKVRSLIHESKLCCYGDINFADCIHAQNVAAREEKQ